MSAREDARARAGAAKSGASSAFYQLESRRDGLHGRIELLLGQLSETDCAALSAARDATRWKLDHVSVRYGRLGEQGEVATASEMTCAQIAEMGVGVIAAASAAASALDALEEQVGRLEWELRSLPGEEAGARRALLEAAQAVSAREAEGWVVAEGRAELTHLGGLLARTVGQSGQMGLRRQIGGLREVEARAEALVVAADGLQGSREALQARRAGLELAIRRQIGVAEATCHDALAGGHSGHPGISEMITHLQDQIRALHQQLARVEQMEVGRDLSTWKQLRLGLSAGEQAVGAVQMDLRAIVTVAAQTAGAREVLTGEMRACATHLGEAQRYLSQCAGGRAWVSPVWEEARTALQEAITLLERGAEDEAGAALRRARECAAASVRGCEAAVAAVPARLAGARWAHSNALARAELMREVLGLGEEPCEVGRSEEVLAEARILLGEAETALARGDHLRAGELAMEARGRSEEAATHARVARRTLQAQRAQGQAATSAAAETHEA